jgi:hypothetical protein
MLGDRGQRQKQGDRQQDGRDHREASPEQIRYAI